MVLMRVHHERLPKPRRLPSVAVLRRARRVVTAMGIVPGQMNLDWVVGPDVVEELTEHAVVDEQGYVRDANLTPVFLFGHPVRTGARGSQMLMVMREGR